MLREILISLIISALSIFGYHMYLTRSGKLSSSCIKGIYTVNIGESIRELKKLSLEGKIQGDPAERIQKSLDVLARKLPSGYILVPDSFVLGGKRKRINLLTGEVTESEASKRISP